MSDRRARVLLFGGFPPEIGGVVTHNAGLSARLSACGYETVAVSRSVLRSPASGGRSILGAIAILLRHRRRSVAMIQMSGARQLPALALWVLVSLAAGRRRSTVTIHSGRFLDGLDRDPVRRALLAMLARRAGRVFAFSEATAAWWAGHGAAGRVVVTTPFVEVPSPPTPRPSTRGGRRRIVTSGMRLPLYGLHELVLGVGEVAAQREEPLELAMALYGDTDRAYADELEELLDDLRRAGVAVTVVGECSADEFRSFLASGSVYVRNTRSDTYGLAIAEALSVGTPAIATEVCPRPAGCRLYPSADPADLVPALADALAAEPGEATDRPHDGATAIVEAVRSVADDEPVARSGSTAHAEAGRA